MQRLRGSEEGEGKKKSGFEDDCKAGENAGFNCVVRPFRAGTRLAGMSGKAGADRSGKAGKAGKAATWRVLEEPTKATDTNVLRPVNIY